MQPTKKMGCPARCVLREIVRFPQFKVTVFISFIKFKFWKQLRLNLDVNHCRISNGLICFSIMTIMSLRIWGWMIKRQVWSWLSLNWEFQANLLTTFTLTIGRQCYAPDFIRGLGIDDACQVCFWMCQFSSKLMTSIRHENLTLAITLSFFNISSSNF
jgi:hypothetical protein